MALMAWPLVEELFFAASLMVWGYFTKVLTKVFFDRARLYTVAGNSATVYKPFNTVGSCTNGLIYSCGGCVTFKYFKFLFATV